MRTFGTRFINAKAMDDKLVTKDISDRIETAFGQAYANLEIGEPPRKIRKTISHAVKKIVKEINLHVKKEIKRNAKAQLKELKKLKKQRKVSKLKALIKKNSK
jgi:hypothetical protein